MAAESGILNFKRAARKTRGTPIFFNSQNSVCVKASVCEAPRSGSLFLRAHENAGQIPHWH